MLNNFQNPMFNLTPQSMCCPFTEQEIQNHKNRLNLLINQLNNTHNIEEETYINNEINNETGCLSSLLNIKRNELNNNMNNNLMQQQMMFQQQMMAMQADNKASMQNQLNKKTWNLLFDVHNYGRVINIKIDPDKTCKEAIDMFKLKIDFDDDFRFIFNNKILIPEMKINQSELKDFSKILVMTSTFESSYKQNEIL